MNKKGQVMQNLGALGIGIAALCITLVVVFLILAQARTNMEADGSACHNSSYSINATTGQCEDPTDLSAAGFSNAWNSTHRLQVASATIPNWVSIVVITAIGAILIGMVAMFRR